jgi:site-specific DNA-methyltransferase (adenine-specific)
MASRPSPPHILPHRPARRLRFSLGDCLDVLGALASGSIDVIVTAPPDNLGIRYRSYDDTMPRDRYLEWTGEWIRRAARALMGADFSRLLRRRRGTVCHSHALRRMSLTLETGRLIELRRFVPRDR